MLHVFRAPQSVSRPEKYIGDQIVAAIIDQGLYYQDHDNTLRLDPENGEQFYHPDTFLVNMSQNILTFNKVKSGDTCLFIEGLSPAALSLRYYLTLMGIDKVKICGIFHSGCDVPGDLFNNNQNMRSIERSLLTNLDHVFVATDYMASYLDTREVSCHVTGLPYESGIPDNRGRLLPYPHNNRPLTIIFNHRWSDDKNKKLFLDMASYDSVNRYVLLSPKQVDCGSDIELIICPNRESYIDALLQGHIVFSSATLETFGYSVIEGILSGMMPYVPNQASYKELICSDYRYEIDSSIPDIHRQMLDKYSSFVIDKPNTLLKDNESPEYNIVNKLKSIL